MFELKAGLFINRDKKKALLAARKIINWFKEREMPVYMAREDVIGDKQEGILMPRQELAREIDMIIVVGGDGTFLNAARYYAASNTPILGFNVGRMGFLTEMELGRLDYILEDLVAGKYQIEERMMLQGIVVRRGNELTRVLGLNDIVVSKGAFARIIELTLRISGETITTYPGDGLIIATPTGSTAYSLSAGGPIVSPGLRSLIITPICPHTLYARSLVVQDKEKIEIEIARADRRVMLTVDGQEGIRLSKGDMIQFTPAEESTSLVRVAGTTFYEILRNRLNYKNL